MVVDWLLLAVGLAGFLYLVTHARALADRPRRGTALAPSHRGWLLLSLAPLLIAAGALADLVS
jgi:hypothetical protein